MKYFIIIVIVAVVAGVIYRDKIKALLKGKLQEANDKIDAASNELDNVVNANVSPDAQAKIKKLADAALNEAMKLKNGMDGKVYGSQLNDSSNGTGIGGPQNTGIVWPPVSSQKNDGQPTVTPTAQQQLNAALSQAGWPTTQPVVNASPMQSVVPIASPILIDLNKTGNLAPAYSGIRKFVFKEPSSLQDASPDKGL